MPEAVAAIGANTGLAGLAAAMPRRYTLFSNELVHAPAGMLPSPQARPRSAGEPPDAPHQICRTTAALRDWRRDADIIGRPDLDGSTPGGRASILNAAGADLRLR